MSRGLDLIVATIVEGGHSGITKLKRELFLEEELPAFELLMQHYSLYAELPPFELFTQQGIDLPEQSNIPGRSSSFQYNYDQIIKRSKYNLASDHVKVLTSSLRDRNIDRIEEAQHEFSLNLSRFDLNRFSYDAESLMEMTYEKYLTNKEMRLNGVSNAILSGWGPLDALVHSYRGGDLIVFAGRRGAGKSYILARQALRAIINRHRVLYITMEMTALQTADRLAAIHLGLNPDDIITGSLSEENERRFRITVENFNQYPLKMIEGSFDKNITDLVAETKEYRPDAIFIDGSYLLKPEDKRLRSAWEQQANIHQDLKTRLALGCNIPVVCTVQQNRASKRSKDGDGIVAGSDVIEQLASVLVSVLPIKGHTHRRLLKLVKNRDGAEGLFVINYVFSQLNMEVDEELTRIQRDAINGAETRQDQRNQMNTMEDRM